MKIAKTLSLSLLVSAMVSTTAFAGTDNFNRPELGANWTPLMGNQARIVNNKFVAALSYMKFVPGANDTTATANIALTRQDLAHYGGIFVGKASVKFRAEPFDGKYFTMLCIEPTVLSGLPADGECWSVGNGDITKFSKARVTLKTSGSVATVQIDTNKDGTPEWTFSADLEAPLGTGAGLLANTEAITLDNLKTSR